jgi:hypothetical protein
MTDTNYLDNVNETGNICTDFYNVLLGKITVIILQNMSIEKTFVQLGY